MSLSTELDLPPGSLGFVTASPGFGDGIVATSASQKQAKQ